MTLFGPIRRQMVQRRGHRIHGPTAVRIGTTLSRCRVYICRDALASYLRTAREFHHEMGFLCFGTRVRRGRKLYLDVRHIDFVAEGTRAHVEMPARAKACAIAKRPNLQVMGWAHTHPGFGVFWSGTDRENCRDFGASGVNLVLDPLTNELGIAVGTQFVFRGPVNRLLKGAT